MDSFNRMFNSNKHVESSSESDPVGEEFDQEMKKIEREKAREKELIQKMSQIDPEKWKGTGLEDEILTMYQNP